MASMKKILVCEDDVKVRTILIHQIGALGHEVKAASAGKKGFQEASRGNFDLIITDLSMPDWDGYDLAAGLELTGNKTRILVLTAWKDGERLEKIRALSNVVAVVHKPWKLDDLKPWL